MDSYKSDVQCINCNINNVFSKLTNVAILREKLAENIDRLPAEAREHIDKLQILDDGIAIATPMGDIKLVLDNAKTQCPNKIAYSAVDSPVAFGLSIDLQDAGGVNTNAVAALELDLPFMVRSMVGPQLKKGAQKFGEMLKMIPYDSL